MSTLTGTSGGDALTGGTSNDLILGLMGSDTLVGGGGNDTIYGGQGSDSINYGLAGSSGSSMIYGNEGADTIVSVGSSGRNTIIGGQDSADGADFIDATADTGADLILGNGGSDTIQVGVVPQGGLFTFANSIVGGYGADLITTGGLVAGTNGGSNLILGNQGNDSIVLSGGSNTVYGGQDNDLINDSIAGNDMIFGDQGSDTISVFGGNNTIMGGDDSTDGADLIQVGGVGAGAAQAGNDVIFGNGGNDTILTTAQFAGSTDTLVGGYGDDSISLGAGSNDIILGNQGNDTITLGSNTGTDTVFGGQGDDLITTTATAANTGKSVLYGGEGNDIVDAANVATNVTIYGGVDSVGANDGINSLIGGNANDLIFGGSNADTIIGGTGADTMTGGAGADVFRSFGGNSTTAGSSAVTTVNASDSYTGTGSTIVADSITDLNITAGDKLSIRTGATANTATSTAGGTTFQVNGVGNQGNLDNAPGVSTLQQAADTAITGAYASNNNQNAAIFTFQNNTYVAADVDSSHTFAGDGTDYLVKVSGYTGTIDKNSFV